MSRSRLVRGLEILVDKDRQVICVPLGCPRGLSCLGFDLSVWTEELLFSSGTVTSCKIVSY